jgi:LysM domain
MVAIQVLPLEPDPWPEYEADHDDNLDEREAGHGLALPDRATRYRRRRLGALVGLAVAVAGVLALVDLVASGPTGVSDPTAELDARGPIVDDVYVVQPGDTLWTIAERVAPAADPRQVVADLRELVGSVVIDVGDRIPVGELASS